MRHERVLVRVRVLWKRGVRVRGGGAGRAKRQRGILKVAALVVVVLDGEFVERRVLQLERAAALVDVLAFECLPRRHRLRHILILHQRLMCCENKAHQLGYITAVTQTHAHTYRYGVISNFSSLIRNWQEASEGVLRNIVITFAPQHTHSHNHITQTTKLLLTGILHECDDPLDFSKLGKDRIQHIDCDRVQRYLNRNEDDAIGNFLKTNR